MRLSAAQLSALLEGWIGGAFMKCARQRRRYMPVDARVISLFAAIVAFSLPRSIISRPSSPNQLDAAERDIVASAWHGGPNHRRLCDVGELIRHEATDLWAPHKSWPRVNHIAVLEPKQIQTNKRPSSAPYCRKCWRGSMCAAATSGLANS
jgi:hypothetical protein